ncbi:MAG: PIF1 family DEAD/DEAH box helicase [Candidatus Azambacteria bacterium]|nr:PIF1 family DEAD/DEAH box helicase [Candidatus Azambacteria bacterium]
MTQEQALSILKTGANVFLTGAPGSGKTHTVNEYVAYLRAHGVEPAITASTGIAATHIGGMTIHSWSGIGIRTTLQKEDLQSIATSDYIAKRVRRAKVLIIDEISMLSPGTLVMVDAVCREIKQSADPFGGIQIVMVGDFFQLPPIIKKEAGKSIQTTLIEQASEKQARFAYDSSAWTRAHPIVCYLTEQHRQDDTIFLDLLSAIRRNAFGSNHLCHLETRKLERHGAPKSAPKLFSHNVDVDRVNNDMLATLSGEAHSFSMSSQGPYALAAALQRGCLSPETLYLKIGASVMFTKNNPKEGFANGTLGVIEAFDEVSGHPIVATHKGVRITVEPMDWTVEESGKVRARIAQLPLRLAWAITVHKSQGMSLDAAVMDLSAVFEFGQGYVALSRVRRLSGLYLLGWNERAFLVHPEVLAKDELFHVNSATSEVEFSAISSVKLQKMQDDFIVACGGKKRAKRKTPDVQEGKSESGGRFEKMREKHPNAYRAWDKAQDEKLEELFTKGISAADCAKKLGRKGGAIRSRLIKLGLMEE